MIKGLAWSWGFGCARSILLLATGDRMEWSPKETTLACRSYKEGFSDPPPPRAFEHDLIAWVWGLRVGVVAWALGLGPPPPPQVEGSPL